MKASTYLLLSALAIPTLTLFSNAHAKESDPEVVSSVDFNKYSGLWYEIAHEPNFFQKGCLRSTAQYEVLNKSQVSVLNTCYKDQNKVTDIKGVATVVNPEEPAKLKVKFNFFAKGDYWITDLDPAYQWAVVSGPAKKSLFILSRQAPMDPDLLKTILSQLDKKGFRTDNLVFDQY